MQKIINHFFIYLALVTVISFTSCSSDENTSIELTIEEKVTLLESNQWLLKDFEDRVMHEFKAGERLTYYGVDNVFSDPAIPGTEDYVVSANMLIMDFHFGNVYTFELKVLCENNIVEFYRDGQLNTTLYRRGSNYEQCL